MKKENTVIVKKLIRKKLTVATAESCTGGMVASEITSVNGSSKIFQMGVVTYSNESKVKLLKVKKDTLAKHGAVSAETAEEMVKGLMKLSMAKLCVSITGIAGPSGGSKLKPVGTVFISALRNHQDSKPAGVEIHTERFAFKGNREKIRKLASKQALLMLENLTR